MIQCIAKGCPHIFGAEIVEPNFNITYCLKITRQISRKLSIREINLIIPVLESEKLRQETKHQLF